MTAADAPLTDDDAARESWEKFKAENPQAKFTGEHDFGYFYGFIAGRASLAARLDALHAENQRLRKATSDFKTEFLTADRLHTAACAEVAELQVRLGVVRGQRDAVRAERDALRDAITALADKWHHTTTADELRRLLSEAGERP